jgi:cytosine/adenosine deaminase-related metal-dependent hydrolase
VITHDQDNRVIKNGAVLIAGEEIKALGEAELLKSKYPEAEIKDVKGKIIMPGMINTHMHIYSTFARGMDLKTEQPPRHFLEILEKMWWRVDSTLKADDSLDLIAKAVEELGIRADLCYEISDRNGPEQSQDSITESESFLRKIREKDMDHLNGRIGLHASFTLEDETLEQVSDLADELDSSFHIHVAEGRTDLEDSRLRGYNGAVKRLDQYNIWRPGTMAIHGVHLQEGELEILRDNDCYLINNPESNMGNAVGAAPLKEALAKGLKVGLGTDGYTTDMFESIKFANLMLKHQNRDPRLGWTEIPQMVFKTNAQLATETFGPQLGVLKEGAAADIIVVDYKPPTEINSDNTYAHILFGINGGMVDTTIAKGRILMENREVQVVDDEKITHETGEQADDFWRRF